MRKPIIITSILTFTLAICAAGLLAMAKKSGASNGYASDPVNNRNCTSCHSGTVNSGPGSFTIQAPSVFAPGSVVPVAFRLANVQNPNGNGFQATAYDTNLSQLGGWTQTGFDTFINSNYVNQARAGIDQTAWYLYMKTPATATTFSIYTSGLDGDDNGGTSGDRTYTTSHRLTPGAVALSMTAPPKIGTAVPLVLNSPGDGGKTYVMASSFGNTGIPIGTKTVPLSVDSLLLLTVQNLLPTIFSNYRGVLNNQGQAAATINLPAITQLTGFSIYSAFVVLDPPQPNGIGTVSNGLAMRLY